MGRAPCCDGHSLKRGPWTPEEDEKLTNYIQKYGQGSWRTLPKNAGLARCGKSCRLRWTNYLRPDIKRGRFSFEEEETIIQLHGILGNKWSAIAARLPGRTDNEIKNYWNTHIRKRLLRMGIDPVTHNRRLDLLDLSTLLNPSICSYLSNQLHLSTLLGIDPAPPPSDELLSFAARLFPSPSHDHRIFHDQQHQFSDPNMQNLLPPSFLDQPQPQAQPSAAPGETDHQIVSNLNLGGFQSLNYSDNDGLHSSPGSTMDEIFENLDYQQLNGVDWASLNSCRFPSTAVASNIEAGVLCPASTPLCDYKNSPSSSSMQGNSRSSSHDQEDRGDCCCSNLMTMKMEVPELLDLGEFMEK